LLQFRETLGYSILKNITANLKHARFLSRAVAFVHPSSAWRAHTWPPFLKENLDVAVTD